MMTEKLKVAVLLGGLSAEHDVSVCTGLEVLQALDPAKYDAFPVYIALDGQWWVGDALRDVKTYIPDLATRRKLTRVSLNLGDSHRQGRPVLREVGGFLGGKTIPFDVALPALHGTWGEDGPLHGMLEAAGIPHTGPGAGPMAMAMSKVWTMHEAMVRDVPVVNTLLLRRGDAIDGKAACKAVGSKYPLFVKPAYLGSSVGAQVVHHDDALQAALAEVYRLDIAALVQPCVPNLVEYNVAVRRAPDGTLLTSAIERPLRKGETLSFADKYAGSGADKLGRESTSGMAAMSRVLNPPELDKKRESQLRGWAEQVFIGLEMAGAPRLDFLCNDKTGEIWFNEINPIPGGFGSFLWEAAAGEARIGFTELLDLLVTEALERSRSHARVFDPVASGAAIFRKRG